MAWACTGGVHVSRLAAHLVSVPTCARALLAPFPFFSPATAAAATEQSRDATPREPRPFCGGTGCFSQIPIGAST